MLLVFVKRLMVPACVYNQQLCESYIGTEIICHCHLLVIPWNTVNSLQMVLCKVIVFILTEICIQLTHMHMVSEILCLHCKPFLQQLRIYLISAFGTCKHYFKIVTASVYHPFPYFSIHAFSQLHACMQLCIIDTVA